MTDDSELIQVHKPKWEGVNKLRIGVCITGVILCPPAILWLDLHPLAVYGYLWILVISILGVIVESVTIRSRSVILFRGSVEYRSGNRTQSIQFDGSTLANMNFKSLKPSRDEIVGYLLWDKTNKRKMVIHATDGWDEVALRSFEGPFLEVVREHGMQRMKWLDAYLSQGSPE